MQKYTKGRKREVHTWDRKEFSTYKGLSENEHGWSAKVKQEEEGYSMSLKGREATVHPYRQEVYAVIKKEKKKRLLSKDNGKVQKTFTLENIFILHKVSEYRLLVCLVKQLGQVRS